MADSMFNTNGSLSSTDPKVIQAAMRATGGQILPSSPSFKRALELAQLRDVQMQQGMAEGAQAVKSLKEYQAANPPTISGLPSNQVVTSDTGFKAVLDAQGNIVGTNAPVTAGKKIYDKVLGTSNDPTSGQNIRDAFLKEYAKPKPVAEMPSMPAPAGVRAPAQTPIGPAAAQLINQDYLGDTLNPNLNALMASGEGVRRGPPTSIFGSEGVGAQMAKEAKARETEAKTAAVRSKVKEAEDAVYAAQATGRATPAEIEGLLINVAKAQSEANKFLSPEEAKAKAAAAFTDSWDVDLPGILPAFRVAAVDSPGIIPSIKATAESLRLGTLDNFRNYISNPISSGIFGNPEAPLSTEKQDYLMYQEDLQKVREVLFPKKTP